MSEKAKKTYRAPRVEAAASAAGDRPPKTFQSAKRSEDPPTASAAAAKADTTRSASDSGYSSKAHTSPSDSHSDLVKRDNAVQAPPRSTPYVNTHHPRKESLDDRKSRPRPKPASSSGAAAGKHRSSSPPPPLWSNAGGAPINALRINTAPSTSALARVPLQPSPAMYGPPMGSYPPSTPHYQYDPYPWSQSHPISAPPTSTVPLQQAPGYFSNPPVPMPHHHSQSAQPRIRSAQQPGHYCPPTPQYHTYQPPLAPSPGIATPPVPPSTMPPPQRPALDYRHTMATVNQVQTQGPSLRQPQDTPFHHQALVARRPSGSSDLRNTEEWYDPTDGKRKRWNNGRLQYLEEPRKQGSSTRPRRPRPFIEDSEADGYDSEESSSSSLSSSDDDYERRRSPRKALLRRQTTSELHRSPQKTRRDSQQSEGGTHHLSEERQKLAAVAAYQDASSTPRKQKARQPSFINDTARATKGGSPRTSAPPSPTASRSRVSETRSSNHGGRRSLVLESDGPFGFRHDDQEFHVDAPPGQKVQLTINGRQEKRYVDEGSTGISPSRRRPSAASSMKETARRPKNSTKLVERSTATTMDELGAAAQGMSLGDDRAPEQAWDD